MRVKGWPVGLLDNRYEFVQEGRCGRVAAANSMLSHRSPDHLAPETRLVFQRELAGFAFKGDAEVEPIFGNAVGLISIELAEKAYAMFI